MSSLKKINVVGLGPGNPDYITKKGIEYISNCDIAIGGKRQLEEVSFLLSPSCEKYTLNKLNDVIDFIKENRERQMCVIVSGDTGFYSLLPFLRKHFKKSELDVVPGISSYQYLFSRLGEAWHEYELLSVHGREMDYINVLRHSKGVILLTDDKNTPYIIAKKVYDNGFKNMEIIIGERLAYPDEKITITNIENFNTLNREYKMNIAVIRQK